jgi:hypothetical protein
VLGGDAVGVEFGAEPGSELEPAIETLRITATNRAFQAIAGISALMCLVAAAIAWLTQPSWGGGSKAGTPPG